MTTEDDIKALTYEINPSDSGDEKRQGGEWEESKAQEGEGEETKIE